MSTRKLLFRANRADHHLATPTRLVWRLRRTSSAPSTASTCKRLTSGSVCAVVRSSNILKLRLEASPHAVRPLLATLHRVLPVRWAASAPSIASIWQPPISGSVYAGKQSSSTRMLHSRARRAARPILETVRLVFRASRSFSAQSIASIYKPPILGSVCAVGQRSSTQRKACAPNGPQLWERRR